jgi:hypothetical protein
MRGLWRNTGTRIFLVTLLVYGVCPPFTSFDSFWAVPTALSLIRHGNARVDEYVASAPQASHYALDCVPPVGTAVRYEQARGCPGGHWYNFFPLGVSVLAAPLIFVLQLVTDLFAAAFPTAGASISQPIIASFLKGDLVGGHAVAELGCAATFGAISVWLFYRTLLLFGPPKQAVLLSLLFAFGTAEWSTASRNLLQHGATVMCLLAALYLLIAARGRPRLAAYASLPLAAAFIRRRSDVICHAPLS